MQKRACGLSVDDGGCFGGGFAAGTGRIPWVPAIIVDKIVRSQRDAHKIWLLTINNGRVFPYIERSLRLPVV